MYRTGPIEEYLNAAASGQPTPGGGSVSALTGALGASMACMAANFTVGKEKFAEVEPLVKPALEECTNAYQELLVLMDKDTEAYAQVSAAYSMPKGTDPERLARKEAIQEALKHALKVPLHVMRTCGNIMDQTEILAENANPNLISDVGVAAVLTEAAVRAAELNVAINLNGLERGEFVDEVRAEINAIAHDARTTLQAVMVKVMSKMSGKR